MKIIKYGIIISYFALTGCFLDARLYSNSSETQKSVDGGLPSSEIISFKLENVPKSLPRLFPYKGLAELSISSSGYAFSLSSNSCSGLVIESTTGALSGAIENQQQSICEFSISATNGVKTVVSDPVQVNVGNSFTAQFDKTKIRIEKGVAPTTVTINFSEPAPFNSELQYSFFSLSDLGSVLDGFSRTGSRAVSAGQTQLVLSLELLGSSSFVDVDYQIFSIDSGLRTQNSSSELFLYENSVPNIKSVSSGSGHTCAVTVNGELYCWGGDGSGTLGDGPGVTPTINIPQRIGSFSDWEMVRASAFNTCGIRNKLMYCWGSDSSGAIGNGSGSSANVFAPEQIVGLTNWQWVTSSNGTTCGIESGNLYCWGSDNNGRLGNGGANTSVTSPALISASGDWEQVSANDNYACGIKSGELYCWGNDSDGRLGNGTGVTADQTSPYRVGVLNNWTELATGTSNACGIESGRLFCWGPDDRGQIGNGFLLTANAESPAQVGSDADWEHVGVGFGVVCGVKAGKLFCWGSNFSGVVGIGYASSSVNIHQPLLIDESGVWTLASLGGSVGCGIKDFKLNCWAGSGAYNNGLGKAGGITSSILTKFLEVNSGSSISTYSDNTCLIDKGELYCWGDDTYGQVGNESTSTSEVVYPQKIGVSSDWSFIEVGSFASCGIRSGYLYCWGDTRYGRLGNGVADPLVHVHEPQKIGNLNSWTSVSMAYWHSCGIAAGELYCWGYDSAGQIGNGIAQTSDVLFPQKIGSLNNWQQISVGWSHTCGIESGRLYCWGSDGAGELGNGPVLTTSVHEPTQLGTDSDWTSITLGLDHACGIRSGRLYCWGTDWNEQIGNGNASTNDVDTPELIGAFTDWQSVEEAEERTCGIRNNQAYCWGGVTGEESPTVVAGTNGLSQISASEYYQLYLIGNEIYFRGSDSSGGAIGPLNVFKPTPVVDFQ